MKKREIVQKSQDFAKIINNQKKISNNFFIIYYKENKINKFGISVPKKLGIAVLRNKLKRQLRFLIDKNKLLFPKAYDYIIICKKGCINISFMELQYQFEKLIERWKNEK